MADRGVLWDLDGVLVDTWEQHRQAWSRALTEYAIPFTPELLRATFGMNNAGTLAVLLGAEPAPELVLRVGERKEELFRQAVKGRLHTFSGVNDWLDRLKVAGFRQAIATSAPEANIDTLVDGLRLRRYFAAVVSGYDLPAKPNPAVYLKAAQAIDVPPVRCVVVEDAVAGIEGAKRAGMKCIAVATTNPIAALGGADVIAKRLDALPLDTFERLLG